MPNLNIEIASELMRGIRIKAATEDKTRKDWLIEILEQAVQAPDSRSSESLEPCEAGRA